MGDGATATNTYSGNQTTINDQASKTKIYTTDASGRMTQLIDDPNGVNYATSYLWSAANDLQTVT